MTFSIIVVCLNAGEKLHETIESIQNQTEQDYEIIIKDGGSADEITRTWLDSYRQGEQKDFAQDGAHSVQDQAHGGRIRVYCGKDTGIYDAMNQAVRYVRGDYVLFLNCGDRFYDSNVLARVKGKITHVIKKASQNGHSIFYGNIYECRTNTLVQSNPVIDDFACYRNVPCHQACFYGAALFRERAFDTEYQVRADYEHFLWCYYKGHAGTVYMPITVALYEGGGFSETRENERKSKREHRKIVSIYMPAAKVRKYRLIMLITLAPLRTWIARNPVTAGVYQTIKRKLICSTSEE